MWSNIFLEKMFPDSTKVLSSEYSRGYLEHRLRVRLGMWPLMRTNVCSWGQKREAASGSEPHTLGFHRLQREQRTALGGFKAAGCHDSLWGSDGAFVMPTAGSQLTAAIQTSYDWLLTDLWPPGFNTFLPLGLYTYDKWYYSWIPAGPFCAEFCSSPYWGLRLPPTSQ